MNSAETALAQKILKLATESEKPEERGIFLDQYAVLVRAVSERKCAETYGGQGASSLNSTQLATGIVSQTPTIGRTVIYTLSEEDAEAINRRRTTGEAIAERIKEEKWPLGAQAHIGNSVNVGEQYPAVIVRVWGGTTVNLRVILDGNDDYWATSRMLAEEKDQAGAWDWPNRVG